VLYLPSPRGVIQALDAATGDLLWEYRPGVAQLGVAQPAPSAPGGGGEQTVIPRLAQRPVPASGGGDSDTGRGIQRNRAGKLNWTVEALILDPKWKPLFTELELQKAAARIRDAEKTARAGSPT
jgi:PQQ enzyme repeat